jgi:hypothetical protein
MCIIMLASVLASSFDSSRERLCRSNLHTYLGISSLSIFVS